VRKVRWDDLSGRQKVLAATAMTPQFSLAAAAGTDLVRRSGHQINGSKRMWAAVIVGVNYIGPLLYFRYGRGQTGGGPVRARLR
jgi:Phospholipase_D-nuclease N-terminal